MRAHRFAMLLAAVVAGACATTENFRLKMDGFLGGPESAVIQAYGVPQSSYVMADGDRVISYTRARQVVLPSWGGTQAVTTNTQGTMDIYRPGQAAPTTGNFTARSTTYVPTQVPDTVIPLSCTVNFTVSATGFVTQWSASGNHCVAQK